MFRKFEKITIEGYRSYNRPKKSYFIPYQTQETIYPENKLFSGFEVFRSSSEEHIARSDRCEIVNDDLENMCFET